LLRLIWIVSSIRVKVSVTLGVVVDDNIRVGCVIRNWVLLVGASTVVHLGVHDLAILHLEPTRYLFILIVVIFHDCVEDAVHLLLEQLLETFNHGLIDWAALDEVSD